MRWWPKTVPRVGDTRERDKFAWLPTKMTDGSVIWFERYWVGEVYHRHLVDEAVEVFFWLPVRKVWRPTGT